MTDELKKKVEQAIRLLQSVKVDGPIEVGYSGGKDSDVILELARMANINIRPIYKNTTIDPPGTIKHVLDKGVEIVRPKMGFFDIVKKNGFPTMRTRFCCKYLKEYKILDYAILGIRKSESVKRNARYNEPIVCRYYSSNVKSQQIYPILYWTNDDISEFINEYHVKCHPLYYDSNGRFDVNKRLGCLACPLKSRQVDDFVERPNLVKAWIRAGKVWWNSHPNANSHKKFASIYDLFAHNVFFDSYWKFIEWKHNLFDTVDCKKFLEDYFKIDLP